MDEPGQLGSVSVPARLEAVRTLAAALREACATAGLAEDAAFEIELAMVEAANNIVLHGYEGDEGVIGMEVHQRSRAIEVMLIDTGTPIPDEILDHPGEAGDDSEHGRGIAIIRAFVDGLEYGSRDGINRLLLRKALPD